MTHQVQRPHRRGHTACAVPHARADGTGRCPHTAVVGTVRLLGRVHARRRTDVPTPGLCAR